MAIRAFPSWLVGLMALGALDSGEVQAAGLLDALKAVAQGQSYTVRGRLQVHGGQWLTCFDGITTGYLGAADLARPGDAGVDPATGQVRLTTAAIPAVIMTADGTVTSNDCNSLASQGLLSAVPGAAAPGTAARADTGYSDPYGCVSPDMTSDEIVQDRGRIMQCQSDAITEAAWQRDQARRQQNASALVANPTAAAANPAAVAALQQDVAAQFQAIQAAAGRPATPTTSTPEDLAWDGAKLCGLKPAYMMKLREEALQFLAYETATGQIRMSEFAGGERRDIDLDGNGFAQRAAFNANAIGQGGDACGRAFWDAEAIKAASAAMSAPAP
ncbi:MAG: hypothetical protein AB7P42_19800 [Gammaproteobacteria bacterium]